MRLGDPQLPGRPPAPCRRRSPPPPPPPPLPAAAQPPACSAFRSAAAKAGHSVLQLDSSSHYGGAWASLRLDELRRLLEGAARGGSGGGAGGDSAAAEAEAAGVSVAEVWQRPGADLGPASGYCLDLAPKVCGRWCWLAGWLAGWLAPPRTRVAACQMTLQQPGRAGAPPARPRRPRPPPPGAVRRGVGDPAAAGQRGAPLPGDQAAAGQVRCREAGGVPCF